MKYSVLALVATLCFARVDLAAAQSTSFDIVGLTLGMSQDQALAALEAHDANLDIVINESYFTYSDGVEQFETDSFVARIDARIPGASQPLPHFSLFITPPPQGARVWAVARREQITSAQPTQEQYAQALVQKYGAPAGVSRGGAAMSWDFPAGRQSCVRDPRDEGYPAFRPGRSNDSDLMAILRAGQQGKRVPADLSTCASQLYYLLGTVNGQVISSFEAYLVDVAAYAAAETAAGEHVDRLEADAKKRRESGSQVPRL